MKQPKEKKFKETEIGLIPEVWKEGDLFRDVVQEFITTEHYILENKLNERTITHKLAEYLQRAFLEYSVDCEYNKMHREEDDDIYVSKTLGLESKMIRSDSIKGITVYPDIIVHHRGDNDHNYLVIEVKKKNFADRIRKGQGEESYRDFDQMKLCSYTRELKYTWGIYLEFEGAGICNMAFFRAGQKYE